MQTAQHWMRDYLPVRWRPILSLWLAWNTLFYPLVWPGFVEVRLILPHQSTQMPLAQDEVEVQAFSSHAAQKAFTVGVRFRRAIRGPQDLNAGPLGHACEGSTVLAVVVADQKAWVCWLLCSSIGFRGQLQTDVIDRLGYPGGKSRCSAQVREKGSSAEGILGRIPPVGQTTLRHQQ